MELLNQIGFATLYALTGLVLLGLGYLVLDWLTPGHLGSHIVVERSVNAAIVLACGFIGLGLVIFMAIWANGEVGWTGAELWTVAFGLLGIALQALAFRLLDLLIPGDLAATVTEKEFHPASLVAGSALIAISLVVVASIS